MLNIRWLYTVEQGKNRDKSSACDLWFFFPIFRHDFLAVNFKAHKNFVQVIKNT